MESIIDGLQYLANFFAGIGDFAYAVLVQIGSWVVIWWTRLQLFVLGFLWEVAKAILVNVNLSTLVESSWNSIDDRYWPYLSILKLPEAINVLLQAVTTRYVLRLVGM